MERVPIAHFADPQTAVLTAEFLEHQGFDATFHDKTAWRSPDAGAVVLVARN
jgi:hypothetical protein